jgi:hypothetical protein
VAADGERRELPSFRPGPPATRRHAGHIRTNYDTAGHGATSPFCRVPAEHPSGITFFSSLRFWHIVDERPALHLPA